MLIGLAINPAGVLVGGWLARRIGTWETLPVAAIGLILAFVWILLSPLPRLGAAKPARPCT